MNLPTITMGQICKRAPCTDPLQYANKNWSGTALQVLRHPRISAKHKLWVVLHESALPREMLVEAVCQFAERALSALPADKVDKVGARSIAAIKAARAYMRGEITREELTDAARAARVVAEAASAASAASAARAAEAARAAAPATATAWAAAWAAAEAAEVARAAEQKEQVKILVRLCKDYENN